MAAHCPPRKRAIRGGFDPATIIDTLFASNGWGRSWRDTIYNFVHYHSQTHEVLGVARGDAVVEFGGIKGKRLKVRAGDIAVLPAGTGHRLIKASRNFLVVGAYPLSGTYDECTDTRDPLEAKKRIAKVKRPPRDPVHGKPAGIPLLWRIRNEQRRREAPQGRQVLKRIGPLTQRCRRTLPVRRKI